MSVTTTGRASARERLLAAADELFYAEGVHSVGIDRVIEHAGVAKATLYNAFGSKDELIRAYLLGRLARRQERVARRLVGVDSPRDRILAVFDALTDAFNQPGFRGCAFVNASAEVTPGGKVSEACATSRGWTRSTFREFATEAGVADPDRLAEQLVLLYDGASIAAQLDGNAGAGAAARIVAETLVDAAIHH
ncbi:TetR/AcrR family transcriptional regulator [Micromonospora sp. NBC_01796]|uniref:TetR/AcrR family transcriptional regulator n=1 Tax=Micromonospora sp. NBC_01796 TaxID=2975987 RepID=UPI002DD91FC9|nr:TetR/AcrR family transcriptional regulator [Micromonospora sp. NBC_01796]WSA86596.1 TetR/AcrR family transcriptional regulator [Micromonospora sp. NBC_01796]